jgi:hypothetical protein
MSEPLPLFERVQGVTACAIATSALLWIGQTVSMIGDGIYVFAVAWFVWTSMHRPRCSRSWGGLDVIPQVLLLMATAPCRTGWIAGI